MNVTLPSEIETRLSPGDVVLHLALGLFADEEATLGQAAEIAGMTQAEFLHELGQRHIPLHYGAAELVEDLRTVERLSTP